MGRYHHPSEPCLGRAPGPSVIPIVSVKALLPTRAEAMSTARSVRSITAAGVAFKILRVNWILLVCMVPNLIHVWFLFYLVWFLLNHTHYIFHYPSSLLFLPLDVLALTPSSPNTYPRTYHTPYSRTYTHRGWVPRESTQEKIGCRSPEVVGGQWSPPAGVWLIINGTHTHW